MDFRICSGVAVGPAASPREGTQFRPNPNQFHITIFSPIQRTLGELEVVCPKIHRENRIIEAFPYRRI